MRIDRLLPVVALAVLFAPPATGADGGHTVFGNPVEVRPGDPPMDSFGGGVSTSVIQIAQWQPVVSGTTWSFPTPGYINVNISMSGPNMYAPLDLDNGVEVTQVCARVFDSSTTLEVLMFVSAFESSVAGSLPASTVREAVTTGTTAAPGYTLLCAIVNPVITIRTNADINNDGVSGTVQYYVGITLAQGTSTALGPAVVTWRRTITPTPATVTFNDVPVGHPFLRFVEAMAASGITGGCGNGNFCPDSPLTRGQMAVFLSTALGLHWPN
jgi:hypothetical protein